MARLYEQYKTEIRPNLMKKLGLGNIHQVPKLQKVTLNIGTGNKGLANKEIVEEAVRTLTTISGQKPVLTKARKAVSNFKIRDGWQVGVKVTLRGPMMYEFMDRLIAVTIPRIKDFRGMNPRSFDGRGNYSFGVQEQNIFPEVNLDKIKHTIGMDITISIASDGDRSSYALLKDFGMPFRRESDKFHGFQAEEEK